MPNPIKYSTGSETLALKKGNFYIGTGDVGKGPSDTTGFYQGISPSSGGYVIYMNKSGAPGNLSYHNAPTDAELISFTNNLAGQSYTTVNECLTYYATQTDKVCVNRDYEGIVTDGLILNLDAGFTPSYPKNGTTWYNVGGGSNNGTLINGPTYNSSNGGVIVTDGTNDSISVFYDFSQLSTITISFFANSAYNNESMVWSMGSNGPDWYIKSDTMGYNSYGADTYGFSSAQVTNLGMRNNWKMLTTTYTQNSPVSNNKVYVDGIQQPTSQILGSTNPRGFGNKISFSSDFPGTDYNLTATIGSILIYNRALSADEVLQNYNAQKGRFGL